MYLTAAKPNTFSEPGTPCYRSNAESQIDHYKPREPDIIADGMEVEAEGWLEAAKCH